MQPEFERFRELVTADEALQTALWTITDTQAFVSQAVRLAAERGIALVEGDVWQALAAGRSAWLGIWAP